MTTRGSSHIVTSRSPSFESVSSQSERSARSAENPATPRTNKELKKVVNEAEITGHAEHPEHQPTHSPHQHEVTSTTSPTPTPTPTALKTSPPSSFSPMDTYPDSSESSSHPHPGEKTPVAPPALPITGERPSSHGSQSAGGDEMSIQHGQIDGRSSLMSPFGQHVGGAPPHHHQAAGTWTPQSQQSSASFAEQRGGPHGYVSFTNGHPSEGDPSQPHPVYPMPVTYSPFNFRTPQDTPPTSGTAVSGHDIASSAPGSDMAMPYPAYHQGGYMGPPPPAGYGYPTGYPMDESMQHAYGHPGGYYAPQGGHYMAFPPPGVVGTHRYASPDINGNMIATGPPGVVFARATDPRIVRPKVKLTYDDKRRIVEIARSNTSLRQEDIAQQYGVDRSTISKILIQAHRWTGPPQPSVVPIPKPIKQSGGGRFPAIEKRMDDWMDEQFKLGYEIRDQVARDKAKEIAREMGFTEERFKASAKWLDKFKERRRANGLRASVTATYESSRPNLTLDLSASSGNNSACSTPGGSSTMHGDPGYPHSGHLGAPPQGGFYAPYPAAAAAAAAGVVGHQYSPGGSRNPILSRSQSSATLASSDSSGLDPFLQQQQQHAHAHAQAAAAARGLHGPIKSESDLLSAYGNHNSQYGSAMTDDASSHGRQRSMSSPQGRNAYLSADMSSEPGSLPPASGRVGRVSTGGLVRQNSYGGASPRRPASQLSRTNSTTSSLSGKRSRPSIAAAAFGLTSIENDNNYSPTHGSSSSASSHVPSREYAHGALQPFTSSLSGMSISPGSNSAHPHPLAPMSTAAGYHENGRQHGSYYPQHLSHQMNGQQAQGYHYGYQHQQAQYDAGHPKAEPVAWRQE